MNRLMMELNISLEEFRQGYREIDQVSFLDHDGTLLPSVVGLRMLADGRFVQNIMVSFHELLQALCLMHCSYHGLTFEQQQGKWDALRERAKNYSARVIQVMARAKLAKRHLIKQVTHPGAMRVAMREALPSPEHLMAYMAELQRVAKDKLRPTDSEIMGYFEAADMLAIITCRREQWKHLTPYSRVVNELNQSEMAQILAGANLTSPLPL
jgi:hypothetical protein